MLLDFWNSPWVRASLGPGLLMFVFTFGQYFLVTLFTECNGSLLKLMEDPVGNFQKGFTVPSRESFSHE